MLKLGTYGFLRFGLYLFPEASAWATPALVTLGVIGIIYESRPNVTVDAAGLCLKAGNAVILRGGSEALHSNRALAAVIGGVLAGSGRAGGGDSAARRPSPRARFSPSLITAL
jgi:hypothetical protein